MQLAILSAGLLAIAGAAFGAIGARAIWAEDLHRAQELRRIWDGTEKALRQQIELRDQELSDLRERARGK